MVPVVAGVTVVGSSLVCFTVGVMLMYHSAEAVLDVHVADVTVDVVFVLEPDAVIAIGMSSYSSIFNLCFWVVSNSACTWQGMFWPSTFNNG